VLQDLRGRRTGISGPKLNPGIPRGEGYGLIPTQQHPMRIVHGDGLRGGIRDEFISIVRA
jgi:hypothetical protein